MDDATGCPRCKELIDLAYAATQRHIEVLTRLQMAITNREGDLVEALEFMAEEVGHNRERSPKPTGIISEHTVEQAQGRRHNCTSYVAKIQGKDMCQRWRGNCIA